MTMIPLPDKQYSIILADPPWTYDDRADSGKRGAGHKYSTMSIYDIMALPVRDIAAKDSLLFLWTTGTMQEEAKQVMKAWGYTFRTVAFVWIKTNGNAKLERAMKMAFRLYEQGMSERYVFDELMYDMTFRGMGNHTRSNAEYVYLGSRGKNPERLDKSVGQVVFAPRGKHSEKPVEVIRRIEQIYGDVPRLEMFARGTRQPAWDVWGLEAGE